MFAKLLFAINNGEIKHNIRNNSLRKREYLVKNDTKHLKIKQYKDNNLKSIIVECNNNENIVIEFLIKIFS